MAVQKHDRQAGAAENGDRGLSMGRVQAISDGVFAIVVTLLVLLIDVPPKDLLQGKLLAVLLDDWHKLVAYALSFLLVAIYWWRHYTIFHYLVRTDWTLVGLNLVFLLWIALLPFPTGLICEYYQTPEAGIAIMLYGGVQLVCTLLLLAVWSYAVRGKGLVHELLDATEAARLTRLMVEDAVLYTVATVLSFFAHQIALGIFVVVLLLHFLPRRRQAHMVDLDKFAR